MMDQVDIENLEIKLLLEAVYSVYGYDFRHYAKSSLRRRLTEFRRFCNAESFLQVADKLLRNQDLMNEFIRHLSITVSEMFRDPGFYQSFKKNIIPILQTYPFIKIWSAGCATGEEIFSIAILLHEAGLLDRSILYATDFNNEALAKAKKGIFTTNQTMKFTENYNQFGGENDFSHYYTSKYDYIKLKNFLLDKITFANHNLVTDASFGEMNVILCRNVMIYFDDDLTEHVLGLFKKSLLRRGFLCIGTKESLSFTNINNLYDVIDNKMKIYRLKNHEKI